MHVRSRSPEHTNSLFKCYLPVTWAKLGRGQGRGGRRGHPKNAIKQQKVRGSRRQRPTSEVKSGEAAQVGGKWTPKSGWFQPVVIQGGGLGGGYLSQPPRRLGRWPRRILWPNITPSAKTRVTTFKLQRNQPYTLQIFQRRILGTNLGWTYERLGFAVPCSHGAKTLKKTRLLYIPFLLPFVAAGCASLLVFRKALRVPGCNGS